MVEIAGRKQEKHIIGIDQIFILHELY